MLAMTASFLIVSCWDDDDNNPVPVEIGTDVTVRNTLQTAADPSQGGTGGAEVAIEDIIGVPAGTFELSATVSDGIEFDNYLNNLYDIDISTDAITFTLVAEANDPFYSAFFRTIEAGTFDRYYLTFTGGHNINGSSSDNAAASLNINSTEEVVVIGEGWDFNPGSTFTISLN
ncbi:MAG: hypothetical protein AAFN81_02215 [Bacteroidota bacterium]